MSHRFARAAPPEPGTRECEWCGKPHTHAFELRTKAKAARGSMFVFACREHEAVARRASGHKEES